jgi:hypothetical protein
VIRVKGTNVSFELESGRDVYAPVGNGMLHDDEGDDWPRCSLLCGPFRRGARETKSDEYTRAWFGRGYVPHEGSVDLPPRSLDDWKELGVVHQIWYDRRGIRYPGPFKHRFNRKGLRTFVFGKKRVTLYRQGRFLRLEMPGGCTIDWRGIVSP